MTCVKSRNREANYLAYIGNILKKLKDSFVFLIQVIVIQFTFEMAAAGKKRKTSFYAVSNGRQIGIYTSWERAEEQVYAFKRSVFKSYTTLAEAIQAMRLKGHEDPPIFDDTNDHSNNVSCTQPKVPYNSASDSDLRFDMFFDDNLNPESSDQHKRPFLVMEHDKDLPCGDICPNHAHSDTEIILSHQSPIPDEESKDIVQNNSVQFDDQNHQTDVNNLNQTDSNALITDFISSYQSPICDSQDQNTSVQFDDQNHQTEVKSFIQFDSNAMKTNDSRSTSDQTKEHRCIECDTCKHAHKPADFQKFKSGILQNMSDLITGFMKQTQDTMLLMKDQLVSLQHDFKVQQDQLNVMYKLQEENNIQLKKESTILSQITATGDSLTQKVEKLQSDFQTFTETHENLSPPPDNDMKCDKLPLPLTKLIEQCSHICESNDDLNSGVKNCLKTQEQIKLDIEQLSQEIKSQKASQDDSKISSVESHARMITKSPPFTTPRQDTSNLQTTTTTNGSPSSHHSLLLDNEVSQNDPNEDVDILQHHSYFREKMMKNQTSRKPFLLWLPDTCKNVIIGDSNVRYAVKKRFDSSGATEFRTYHGATYFRISNMLSSMSTIFSHVSNVAFCLGSTDCNRNYIDTERIINDAERLLKAASTSFPNAKITIVGIPPQENGKINHGIKYINDKLYHKLKNTSFSFISCNHLWNHVDINDIPVRGLVTSGSLLSPAAADDFIKPLKDLYTMKQSQHAARKDHNIHQTTGKDVVQPNVSLSAAQPPMPHTNSNNFPPQQIHPNVPTSQQRLPQPSSIHHPPFEIGNNAKTIQRDFHIPHSLQNDASSSSSSSSSYHPNVPHWSLGCPPQYMWNSFLRFMNLFPFHIMNNPPFPPPVMKEAIPANHNIPGNTNLGASIHSQSNNCL